jgi:hypothetical protein
VVRHGGDLRAWGLRGAPRRGPPADPRPCPHRDEGRAKRRGERDASRRDRASHQRVARAAGRRSRRPVPPPLARPVGAAGGDVGRDGAVGGAGAVAVRGRFELRIRPHSPLPGRGAGSRGREPAVHAASQRRGAGRPSLDGGRGLPRVRRARVRPSVRPRDAGDHLASIGLARRVLRPLRVELLSRAVRAGQDRIQLRVRPRHRCYRRGRGPPRLGRGAAMGAGTTGSLGGGRGDLWLDEKTSRRSDELVSAHRTVAEETATAASARARG